MYGLVAAGVTIVGWILYVRYALVPDVIPPDIVRGGSPLHSPFTIANRASFTLYEVKPDCHIVYVKTPGVALTNARSIIPEPTGHIGPGDKRQYTCLLQNLIFQGIGDNYSEFRIAFRVFYGLPLWPARRMKDTRFYVLRRSDGSPYWVEGVPLGEEPSPIPDIYDPPFQGPRPPR